MLCICFSDVVKIVTPQGKVKNSRRQVSELMFDFKIESIGKERYLLICVFYFQLCILIVFIFSTR